VPGSAFPPKLIGALCDDTWKRLFPLLPIHHKLRDDLRRVRALSVMWGTLPAYRPGPSKPVQQGAWMPLSAAHRARLLESVQLFDTRQRVPLNPWPVRGEADGIAHFYFQSYHSVYHTDSWKAPHFREWLKHACRYQPPRYADDEKGCYYPFSQYGGTPVEGDFLPHRVERPKPNVDKKRHEQLVYNRFGFTAPLRIGQQYEDTGLLQDMFQFEYRTFAKLDPKQRAMATAEAVYPTNFLAYARTHAIVALASCNQGTTEASVPRIVRNLYRLYVDTYKCMGSGPDDDGVPVVMGFLPHVVKHKDDRPIVLYAGSLPCLNTKLELFCHSSANSGERVCSLYKQVYLNDAAILHTRMLRAERRRIIHDSNYRRARGKRGPTYTRDRFDTDLIDLQDAYIDFLQTTILGMLIEAGADLRNAPLHLLEPRELEVSMTDEDDDVVGNDYLTPATEEIVKSMDFGGDTLNKTQLAILSLIPPNNRILGTLRLNQSTQVVDMKHIKDTIAKNKTLWGKYLSALVSGSFGTRYLEGMGGGIDYSFDMSAIKDPLKEAAKYADGKFVTTQAHNASSISQKLRANALRKQTGPDSTLGMNTRDFKHAVEMVKKRVNDDVRKSGGMLTHAQCLKKLHIPDHIKHLLRPMYENVAPQ